MNITALEAIDRAYTEGIDTWEMLVSIGASTEENMTTQRWIQGDAAMRVETQYGDKSLSKFASAINVKHNTLRQRCQMARYYEPDTRYQFEGISYSHFREAMKLGDIGKSLWALEKASAKDWPVWKFELLLKRLLGKRRNSDTAEGIIQNYSAAIGVYTLEIRVSEDDFKWLVDAYKVTIRAK